MLWPSAAPHICHIEACAHLSTRASSKVAPCLQLRIGQHVRVNVFEVNIRVLGGLLSSHLLALDPDLNLLQRPRKQHQHEYKGQLLTLARRLADRMLPAFVESDTGRQNSR